MKKTISNQNGGTLVIGMIMLLLMTILSLTIFRMGKSELLISSNAQQREQSMAAAQSAIEEVISNPKFSDTPTAAIPTPCNGVANTKCTDVNADETTDITVAVTPTCLSAQIVPVSLLNFNDSNDRSCLINANQDAGIEDALNNNSLCSNVLWDIQATATDTVKQSEYVANQGVTVRTLSTACP